MKSLGNYVVSKKRGLYFLSYVILLTIWVAVNLVVVESIQRPSLLLAYLIGIVVPSFIVMKSKIDPFEPIAWFSLMYYLLFVDAIYLINTDFLTAEHNLFPGYLSYRALETVLFFCFLAYIAFFLGYYVVYQNTVLSRPHFTDRHKLPEWLVWLFVVLCLLVGFINFVWNLWQYPADHPLGLLLDFGARNHRIDKIQGYYTTLGYQLYLAGLFLWLFLLGRNEERPSRLFWVAITIGLVILISTGRIFNTLSVLLAFMAIGYYCSRDNNRVATHLLWGIPLLFISATVIYFIRIISNMYYVSHEEWTLSLMLSQLSEMISTVLALIIGKGNIPNLPVLMTVFDKYGVEIDYKLGETFSYWTAAFIPNRDIHYVGHEISELWYSQSVGGLPPTIMGEFYINFGFGGALLAMALLGMSISVFYFAIGHISSYWLYVIYAAILMRFVFIIPKVETAVLSNAVWLFLPTLSIYFVMRFLNVFLNAAIAWRR